MIVLTFLAVISLAAAIAFKAGGYRDFSFISSLIGLVMVSGALLLKHYSNSGI